MRQQILDANRLATVPKLTFLVGKGGVGRTTLCASLGLAASRRRLRTLVVEVSERQSIPEMFKVQAMGYQPVQLGENLWTCRVTWEDAIKEYGLMKLRFKAAYRLVFENPFMRRLLPAVPGVAEIVAIGKIIHLATDGVAGLGQFDTVIVDSPATGHGISLVAAPSVVVQTVPAGPMAEDAKRLLDLLKDPAFSRFQIVSIPEEMPISETLELYDSLAVNLGLPLGQIFMNQVYRYGLDSRQAEALSALSGINKTPGVCSAIYASKFMTLKSDFQRDLIVKLARKVPLPIIELSDVRSERDAFTRIDLLSRQLDARVWREER